MVVERSEDMTTVASNQQQQQQQQQPQEQETAPKQTRTSSYRVLGTLLPAQSEDSDSEEDPMAWADLEEFGGTKKTLEKHSKKRAAKLTPEEVRAQLHELSEMDAKTPATKPKKGVLHTIEWLKKHSQGDDDASARRRSHSSSFVRSVLGFFHGGGSRVVDHDDADADKDGNQTELVPLTKPWGQRALACDWTTLGFALLNQPILDDMKRVRVVIESNELVGATAKALVALAKWLRLFDQHVSHVVTIKEYLLEERTLLAGVGYRVTTLYDTYKEGARRGARADPRRPPRPRRRDPAHVCRPRGRAHRRAGRRQGRDLADADGRPGVRGAEPGLPPPERRRGVRRRRGATAGLDEDGDGGRGDARVPRAL
ncbi:hypothetical protein PINS_up011510 [Pythium insidiosum]|nr:hypothetical protein PINS_up011510 [Pythium insidiosum]